MFTEFVTDSFEEAAKPLSDVIKKTQPVSILKQTTSGSKEGCWQAGVC